jgi:hypothetical protein
MNILEKIKNVKPKDVMGIGMAIVAGVVAVSNSISDQKKAQEFEDMKKALSELQNK